MNLKKITFLLKNAAYITDDNMVYLTYNEGEVIKMESIVEDITSYYYVYYIS